MNRTDVGGIYLIPLDGGDPRLMVQSQPSAFSFSPTFAPDGRRLAYASALAALALAGMVGLGIPQSAVHAQLKPETAVQMPGRAADLQRQLEDLFQAQNKSSRKDMTTIAATFLRVTVVI